MPTYQQALTPRTVASLRALFLTELAAAGSTVSGWSTGAPQRAFLEGEANAMAFETQLRVALAQTASIELCKEAGPEWVDAKMTWFDLDNGSGGKGRIPASRAVWTVDLEITAALGALTINSANASGIQLQSTTGVVFQCTQTSDVVINVGSGYVGTVEFTAVVAGINGVTPGSITKVIAGPAGLSVDLGGTQTNTSVARDEEDDDSFIARGLGRWARVGAGWVLPAFDYLIPLYGNNGTTLNVTRWVVDDSNPGGPGTIAVWLANSTGPATVDEVNAVDTGLNSTSVKPVGTGAAAVAAAVSHALAITATIVTDGTNPTVTADATDAIATLETQFPMGPATLEPDVVRAILMGAPIAEQTVATAPGQSEQMALALPGFSSVLEVSVLSLAAPEVLAMGEVIDITLVLTVV